MIKEISITVQPDDEKNAGLHKSLVIKELKKFITSLSKKTNINKLQNFSIISI